MCVSNVATTPVTGSIVRIFIDSILKHFTDTTVTYGLTVQPTSASIWCYSLWNAFNLIKTEDLDKFSSISMTNHNEQTSKQPTSNSNWSIYIVPSTRRTRMHDRAYQIRSVCFPVSVYRFKQACFRLMTKCGICRVQQFQIWQQPVPRLQCWNREKSFDADTSMCPWYDKPARWRSAQFRSAWYNNI